MKVAEPRGCQVENPDDVEILRKIPRPVLGSPIADSGRRFGPDMGLFTAPGSRFAQAVLLEDLLNLRLGPFALPCSRPQ